MRNYQSSSAKMIIHGARLYKSSGPFVIFLLISLMICWNSCLADTKPEALEIDVTHTSIDDLLNMNVSTVSKVEESYWSSAAAIYVLNSEKIRRSGVTSIPEAIRLVPGVQVARIDANKWAVSVRGFSSQTSNKLLVLIDGRSVYDLLFSGVFWESKDVMLEDVERIEVIRGPGGTLWGTNAVNGVINIITKSAKDTQGGLVATGAGSEERGFGSVRYGAKVGNDDYMRIYGKFQDRDSGYIAGHEPDDDSRFGQVGFRLDSAVSSDSSMTFQGDMYDGKQGNLDNSVAAEQETSGGNLMLRWKRVFQDQSSLTTLSYYDHTQLDHPLLDEKRDTFAVETQYMFQPYESHRMVIGLNYKYSSDQTDNGTLLTLDPDKRSDSQIGFFLEDSIELVDAKTFLTLGSKFENNDYTGLEVKPTIRLSWLLYPSNSIWSAISRAVRVPSRLEDDAVISVPGGQTFRGDRNVDSESVVAYELGYRALLTDPIVFDLVGFYNTYDNLITTEELTFGNKSYGSSYGSSVVLSWQPLTNWRLESIYSYFRMDLELDRDSLDNPATRVDGIEGADSRNICSLQSLLDIGDRWELDTIIRYVDSLPTQNVESYLVADLRLGYKLSSKIDLSLVGQNLLDNHHFEQNSQNSTAVQHGVYGKIVWRF